MVTREHHVTPKWPKGIITTLAKADFLKSHTHYYLEKTSVWEPKISSRRVYIVGFYGEKAVPPSLEFIFRMYENAPI